MKRIFKDMMKIIEDNIKIIGDKIKVIFEDKIKVIFGGKIKNIFEKQYKEEYEFLPDALEIIESPNSPIGKFIIWAISIFVIIALLWSYFGKIDIVATSEGKIIPYGNVKVVQPFEEGVITGIHVEDGQKVQKGELLLELDPTIKEVDIEKTKKLLDEVTLEKEVIVSIVNGSNFEDILAKYSSDDESKEHIIKYYNSIMDNSKTSLDVLDSKFEQGKINIELTEDELNEIKGNVEYYEKSIVNLKEEMEVKSSGEEQLDKIATEIDSLKEIEGKYKTLYEADAVSQADWKEKFDQLELKKAEYKIQQKTVEEIKASNNDKLISLESELENSKNKLKSQRTNINLSKAQASELNNNISDFKTAANMKWLNLIVEKDKQITEYSAELDKNNSSLEHNKLSSPVSGEIYGMTVNTIGSVAKPAESIITIVPDGTELIVEAMVLNKDIGFVKEAQEAIIKVNTYPFQKFGTIKGEVIEISPNSYRDETKGYVYKVKIRIEKSNLENEGISYPISCGMEVTAEIKTGKRRIIDFFLEPIIKYVDESIKIR